MLYSTIASLGLLNSCNDLSSFYQGVNCCDAPTKLLDVKLEEVKTSYKAEKDYKALDTGYDFIIAGGGTGGLGVLRGLGGVALSRPEVKTLVVEAGRYIKPELAKVKYSLTRKDTKSGNTTTVQKEKMVSVNWPAAVDNFLRMFCYPHDKISGRDGKDGVDVVPELMQHLDYEHPKSRCIHNYFISPYVHSRNVMESAYLQNLLNRFLANPESMGDVSSLEDIEITLDEKDLSNGAVWNTYFGEQKPDLSSERTYTFKGNPIALVEDAIADLHRNQFTGGYMGSEDQFYYTATYGSDGSGSYEQNYPRGKTLGGSSVTNAGVHYGVTDKVLEKYAKITGNAEWKSQDVKDIVLSSVADTSECDYTDPSKPVGKNGKNINCIAPVTSMTNDQYPNANKDKVGCNNAAGFNQLQKQMFTTYPGYETRNEDLNANILSNSFLKADREKATLTTRSMNPWSGQRSSSADAITNLIALGVHVCWFPATPSNGVETNTSKLILSKHVLPSQGCNGDCNCENPSPSGTGTVADDASVHIRTGAFVTNLKFDENDPTRVTGMEWVYEFEQDHPDRNRLRPNIGVQCTASESLYGNGVDGSVDCPNTVTNYEVSAGRGAPPGVNYRFKTVSESTQNIINGRTATPMGIIRETAGPHEMSSVQAGVSSDPPMKPPKNVKSVMAKREVILSLGAPATTALLMRSGISSEEDSKRLGTQHRSNVMTGKTMLDNYEGLITLAFKRFDFGSSFQFFCDKMWSERSVEESALFTQRDALPGDNDNIPYHAAFSKLRLHNRLGGPHKIYDSNTHLFGSFVVGFPSSIYTLRNGQESVGYYVHDTGGFPWLTNGIVVETTGGTDASLATNALHIETTNPFERISWSIAREGLTEERCAVYRETMDWFYDSMKALYPDDDFEYVGLTKRKKSMIHFSVPSGGQEEKNRYGSVAPFSFEVNHLRTTSTADIARYFNDTENPIIGGYQRDHDVYPQSKFCDDLMMVMSGHHIMGGAIMGKPEDKYAVTDGFARVYGIKGLRVADTSIMTVASDGNPWVTVWQMGNVISKFIAEEWKLNTKNMFDNANPADSSHPHHRNEHF